MRISDWSSDVCSSDLSRAGRQPEAEEIERRQRSYGAGEGEGQKGDGGDHGVGQHMADHDGGIAGPQRPGGAHVVEVARAQELRAHHADDAHPRSEEHTSELQSLMRTSYAVFCLTKQHTLILTTN